MASAATSALAQADPAPAPAEKPAPAQKPAAKAKSDAKPAAATKADQGPAAVKEVTVTARTDDFRTAIDRRSYDITKDLQATSGSIADALRNVPSVEVDVNGNVSLRGDANVKILIDGKPSAMLSGQVAAQTLQQLPASQIERVEVITNPSAEFSPDGSAGIINLVTKKTRKPGTTGGMRANVGNEGRWNGGANIAVRKDKLTVAADMNLRHDANHSQFDTTLQGLDPVTHLPFSQATHGTVKGVNDYQGVHGSLDYDLTPKDRLSAEASYNRFSNSATAATTFETDNNLGVPTGAFSTDGHNTFAFRNYGGSTTWRHTFAGDQHDLVVNLSRQQTHNDNDNRYVEAFTIPAVSTIAFDRAARQDNAFTELKADYQRPLPNDGRLKLGYDLQVNNDVYDDAVSTGVTLASLVPDPTQTDRFKFDQTIHAGYVTWQQPAGEKLTVQGGLRLETVSIRYDDVTTHQSGDRNYTRLYPTLHLGWKIDDHQQLSASYSQRVQRPNGQDFNPFVVVSTPFSERSGNPNLQPQLTQSYEAGWQYRNAGTFYLATLYYRENKDSVTDVTTDLGGGVLLSTKENLGRSKAAGLELVANGKLTKTLTYNISSNAFWSQVDASGLGFGQREAWVVSGRGNVNWQATPKDLLQVNTFVIGKQLMAQGYRNPAAVLNLGYRHKFDDSLSFVATGRDVLDTARFGTTLDTPVLHQRSTFEPRQRSIFIGLSYTFGGRSPRDNQFDYGSGGGNGGPGA